MSRRPTRPNHHTLTPLEMACHADAEHQRNRESGFLACLFLVLSPMLVVLSVYALSCLGVLK